MEPTIKAAPDLARKFVGVARAQGAASARIVGGCDHAGEPVVKMGGAILVGSRCLGEVMRKTAQAEWVDGATADVPEKVRFPFMMILGETISVSYGKVAKRIENGTEDDLVFYYQGLLQQAGLTAGPIARPVPAPFQKPGLLARLFGTSGAS